MPEAIWKQCTDDQCNGYGYNTSHRYNFGIEIPCEVCDGDGGWWFVEGLGRFTNEQYKDALEVQAESSTSEGGAK